MSDARALPECADLADDELVSAFEGGTLSPGTFHHADHVRVGFLVLCQYPAWEALGRFSTALRQLAAASGDAARYHETVTWAFLLLIRERLVRWQLEQGTTPAWTVFAAANPDLLTWKDHVLRAYYTDETLGSAMARQTFVMPDRALPRATGQTVRTEG